MDPIIFGIGLALAVAIVLVMVRKYHQEAQASRAETASEIRKLRLDSRARISTAKMRNTPETELDVLRRLGRVTRAHRVVVGGDPESQQFLNVGGKRPNLTEEVNPGDRDTNGD